MSAPTRDRSLLFRLRAWLFVIVIGASVIVIGTLATLLFWLPLRGVWNLVTVWAHFFVWCSRVIAGVGVRVSGLENLTDPACVYFAKHQSTWETLAFQTLFPHYVWIVKQEARKIPFFGWGLNSLRPIWINRRSGLSAIEQICRQGRERLEQGIGILIFPEGTRVAAGTTRRFKKGGAILAKRTGAKVVPIAHNAGTFWPSKTLFFSRPGTIDVVIGQAIDPSDLSEEQIIEQAENWINQTVARLEAGVG